MLKRCFKAAFGMVKGGFIYASYDSLECFKNTSDLLKYASRMLKLYIKDAQREQWDIPQEESSQELLKSNKNLSWKIPHFVLCFLKRFCVHFSFFTRRNFMPQALLSYQRETFVFTRPRF